MLGEQAKFPDGYLTTQVLMARRGDDFSGVVFWPQGGRSWKFSDIVTLMRIYEVMCNAAQYPQATYQLRDFKEDSKGKGLDSLKDIENNDKIDRQPTFVVKVQYRQNASWQGTIQWVDENKEAKFRSTLELIKLMDSAIEGGEWG